MTEPTEEQLWRIPATAERLGLSDTTVRRMIREGALEAVSVRGRLRVKQTAIEAFIADLGGTSVPA